MLEMGIVVPESESVRTALERFRCARNASARRSLGITVARPSTVSMVPGLRATRSTAGAAGLAEASCGGLACGNGGCGASAGAAGGGSASAVAGACGSGVASRQRGLRGGGRRCRHRRLACIGGGRRCSGRRLGVGCGTGGRRCCLSSSAAVAAAALPAILRHSSDVAVMLIERRGEGMAAGAVRHEVRAFRSARGSARPRGRHGRDWRWGRAAGR